VMNLRSGHAGFVVAKVAFELVFSEYFFFLAKYTNHSKFRFYWVLMLVHNTQNHWVSGLCPSSGVLTTRKHDIS
jgi:hypothetical protein